MLRPLRPFCELPPLLQLNGPELSQVPSYGLAPPILAFGACVTLLRLLGDGPPLQQPQLRDAGALPRQV